VIGTTHDKFKDVLQKKIQQKRWENALGTEDVYEKDQELEELKKIKNYGEIIKKAMRSTLDKGMDTEILMLQEEAIQISDLLVELDHIMDDIQGLDKLDYLETEYSQLLGKF